MRPEENTPEMNEAEARIAERKAKREKANKEKPLKLAMLGLAVIAVALAVALVYIYNDRTSLIDELEDEKAELTRQMVQLRSDYDDLTSDYAYINSQLDSSKEQVSQLIERIQKTEATNRSRIRQYEKELGTLRSIMKHYIVQIDSLNTLNKNLQASEAAARRDLAKVQKENDAMNKTISHLSGQVAAGSVLKARAVSIMACNNGGKSIDVARKTVRLLTSLTLIANDLAPKGWTRIYIVVKDPEGNVLLPIGSDGQAFTCAGTAMTASASREVDYQGEEVDLSIYLNDVAAFVKGSYSVDVYTTSALLGSAELVLR